MAEIMGRIHSVETFGALDGPGIRYVLFLQGCPLRCAFCHNPDTWECADGKLVSAEQAAEDILRYKNFIAGGGVTLSGGEPLLQADFCREVLARCRAAGLHTAIDTSGSVPLKICKPAIDAADMLLLDIKAIDPDVCRKLTGQDNRSALEILNYCELTGKEVWIRHVMVPGITLEKSQLTRLADFIKGYSCVTKVELLPFHKMGEYKWETLKLPYTLSDTPEPTRQEIEMARNIFTERGLKL